MGKKNNKAKVKETVVPSTSACPHDRKAFDLDLAQFPELSFSEANDL